MTDAAAPAVPSTPDPQPVDNPADQPAEIDETWLDGEIPPGVDVFDRKYVEGIRHNAGAYRQRAHTAEARATELEPWEVFNQFGDRDQEVWKFLGDSWQANAENPVEAAQLMREISDRVLGAQTDTPTTPPGETPAAMPDTNMQPVAIPEPTMTPDAVAQIVQDAIASQQKVNHEANSMKELNDRIGAAGYAEGSLESLSVMWYMNRDPETEGDLDKAIAKFQGRGQVVIDDFVAGKTTNPLPMAPGGTGGQDTPSEPRRGHEFNDARKGADAWLESQAAGR